MGSRTAVKAAAAQSGSLLLISCCLQLLLARDRKLPCQSDTLVGTQQSLHSAAIASANAAAAGDWPELRSRDANRQQLASKQSAERSNGAQQRTQSSSEAAQQEWLGAQTVLVSGLGREHGGGRMRLTRIAMVITGSSRVALRLSAH